VGVTLPTLAVSPTPRSAAMQLVAGQHLEVRYTQPDGTQLTANTVFR
jgi:hypothetical protein